MITQADSLLRALSWALAHSIWQGIVAAFALLLLLPRLRTARQKYRAAYGALMALLLAAVGTVWWYYEPNILSALPLDNQGVNGVFEISEGGFLPAFQVSIAEQCTQWLEQNAALLVALWALGWLFFLLQIGSGLWQIRLLKTQGIQTLAASWHEKVAHISRQLGMRQTVRLLESARVRTPLTIGWLKPVILLPIGFVNHLSINEIEAVLAHELAHIARRDWLFNLLQAIVESLFYYHPAVWWITQIIRRERENACDDVALAATGNPLAFARALVQVQEMATSAPALALAARGPKGGLLLARIRRILNQSPPQQHRIMEKMIATFILVALLALVGLRANSVPAIEAAFAQVSAFPANWWNEQTPDNLIENDTVPKPKSTQKITREDENGRVEVEYQDGEVTRLNIDGKDISSAEYEAHQDLLESLQADMPPAPPAPPAPFWNQYGANGGIWMFPSAPTPPGTAPAAPHGFYFKSPSAPMAPPFPSMPSFSNGFSITTDQDESGNTIIHLENGEHASEMLIKDNEVWIDGKKLETGETWDLPGMEWPGEGSFSFDDGMDFQGYFSAEHFEKTIEEMAKASEEMAKAMEEHREEWEKSHFRWEKEQKAAQKQWNKEQRQGEKEQKKQQEEKASWEARTQATNARIKVALLRDRLIDDSDDFEFKLSAKSLKINGKKQSEALRQKYQNLIKESNKSALDGEDWEYHIRF